MAVLSRVEVYRWRARASLGSQDRLGEIQRRGLLLVARTTDTQHKLLPTRSGDAKRAAVLCNAKAKTKAKTKAKGKKQRRRRDVRDRTCNMRTEVSIEAPSVVKMAKCYLLEAGDCPLLAQGNRSERGWRDMGR